MNAVVKRLLGVKNALLGYLYGVALQVNPVCRFGGFVLIR